MMKRKLMMLTAFLVVMLCCVPLANADDEITFSGDFELCNLAKGYYSSYVTVSGGNPDYNGYTYEVVSGELPDSLSTRSDYSYVYDDDGNYVYEYRCYLRGTPSTAGTWTFTLRATDRDGNSAEQEYTFTVTDAMYFTDPGSLSGSAYVGTWYKGESITVGGGMPDYTFIIDGGLPQGLYLRENPEGAYFSYYDDDGNYHYGYRPSFWIEGVPTEAGDRTFVLKVTDSNDKQLEVSNTISVTVSGDYTAPTPTDYTAITGSYTEEIKVGASYSAELKLQGVEDNKAVWSIVKGKLPPGMYMSPSGNSVTLEGTLTTAGTYEFTLRGVDSGNTYAEKAMTIKVNDTPYEASDITVTGSLQSDWKMNEEYSEYITASGHYGDISASVTSGDLPPGLSLRTSYNGYSDSYYYRHYNHNRCTLSGTPSKAGTYTFTIRLTDDRLAYVDKTFTVTIHDVPYLASDISFTGDAQTERRLYASYSNSLSLSGYTGSISMSVVKGSLPPGISLGQSYSSSSWTLSGIPNTAGTYTFILRAIDSRNAYIDKAFTIKINGEPYAADDMSITADWSRIWTTNTNDSLSAQVYGCVDALHVTITSGDLPPGLSITGSYSSSYSGSTCTLAGIPNTPGTYAFTLRATDRRNAYTERDFSITISGDAKPEPSLNPSMSLNGTFADGYTISNWYSESVQIVGGTPSYTFKVTGGSIPPGFAVRLYTSDGEQRLNLRGIPDKAGTYTFKLRVIDSNNTYTENEYTVKIDGETKKSDEMTITGRFPDTSTADTWYSERVQVSGGNPSYTFKITSGDLPAGFYIHQNSTSFYLEGIPTKPGAYTFGLRITDSHNEYAERSITMNISGDALTVPEPLDPVIITTTSLNEAITGREYSDTIEFEGTATTWQISSGDLPSGLTINAATGVISGTVSTDAIEHNANDAKTYTFSVTASNASGGSATKSFTMSVIEPVKFADDVALPNAQAEEEYEVSLNINGTLLNGINCSISGLPSGLRYTTTGRTCTISGTPTSSGSYRVTFSAYNYRRYYYDSVTRDSKEFLFTVTPPPEPITIKTTALEAAGTGRAYSQTLSADGRVDHWGITSGSLPDGLSLDASTGVISGTVPDSVVERIINTYYSNAKSFSFTVTASNDTGRSDSKSLSIMAYEPAKIITAELPHATAGVDYSADIVGGGLWRNEYSTPWVRVKDGLPEGLTWTLTDAGIVEIRGMPVEEGEYNVSAIIENGYSNEEKVFVLTVEPRPTPALRPTITLPKNDTMGYAGQAYSLQPTATGTTPITWSAEGDLPPGLSVNADTGAITGTLTALDEGKYSHNKLNYTFTLNARNRGGNDSTSVNISVWYVPEFATAASLPDAALNTSYNQTITVEGTELSMTWKKASGSLPTGLTLTMNKNMRTATITGSPTKKGDFTFTLEVQNNSGTTKHTARREFRLSVKEDTSGGTGAPVISETALPGATTGASYAALLTATGQKPITWSKSGSFPKGLKLDKYGTITGTPTKAGEYTFTATAKNKAGKTSQTLTITVAGEATSKPKITTAKIANPTMNEPYSVQLEATGTNTRTCPMIWSMEGKKYPSGMYITESGLLAGIPKEAGSFTIKVKAENNLGSATKSYSVKVVGLAPEIVNRTDQIPSGTVKEAYATQLLAEGSTPITWSKSGKFPSGLKLNSKTGEITGKPTKASSFTFTAKAKNKYGTATREYTIVIAAAASTLPEAGEIPAETPEIIIETPEAITETPEIMTDNAEIPAEATNDVDMWVVSGDEELRGEIYVPEGEPITFRIGAVLDGAEVYIADEAIAIDVDGDGFTLPGELVRDEFVIYVMAGNTKTIELYIVAEQDEQD